MTLLLTTYRTREDFTIDELVAVTGDLLRQAALLQARWKVTSVPDGRTIRYYSSTGLLPKPLGYRGSAALFGYRHLLTLLAIKTLQARFLPLRKIREVVEPLENKALEELIQRGAPADPAGWMLHDPGGQEYASEPPRSRGKSGGAESRRSPRAGDATPLPDLPLKGLAAPNPEALTWERLEVESGLELQIRSDYAGAAGPSGLNAVLSKIRVLLQARQTRRAEADGSEERPDSPRRK